ncbi:MAG: exodeoxyribonuclease VII large subunit [Clostridia bacterium]|nr:exodeoxyribonuclease VII large subunit [Clostridia bacterium]
MNQQTDRQTLTVSELNGCIKAILEGTPVLKDVFVQGEISGAKLYGSGHFYFSLKDTDSVVSAVMFRGQYSRLRFRPDNGMRVIIRGRVSVYEPRGQYQLIAETMAPDGAGALAIAFEQLKAKLNGEGLFDPARRKPLPPYPRRIGVVTSPSGAAVHDIIRTAGKRLPSVEILLYPSAVQGTEAPASLAGGIRYFNRVKGDSEQGVDLIIIGRGGGSAEDLWCFNDEGLARVIAASEIPVISAVGHEVDFSIADFVADCRAATPTAAAETAVPDRNDLNRRLKALTDRMTAAITASLTAGRTRLDRAASARVLAAPEGVVTPRREQLDALSHRLAQASPASAIAHHKNQTDALEGRLELSIANRLGTCEKELHRLCGQLEALSPLGVLGRGYTLVRRSDGCLAPRAEDLSVGESITVRFSDGTADACVTALHPDNT